MKPIKPGVEFWGPDPKMAAIKRKAAKIMYQINQAPPEKREKICREFIPKLFKSVGEHTFFEIPFNCDFGCFTEIGSNCYFNHHFSIGDSGQVKIGDFVLVGPYVGLYTAQHPLDSQKRKANLQTVQPITIGNNVWIGANCTILGGVTIGDNVVIGAGSVVTRNIPSNSLAYGVPCRVRKTLK